MSLFFGRKSRIFLAVFILSGAFLFMLGAEPAQAYHATSSYNKLFNDTLTSQNWNDLFGDFVNTWLPVSMNGPLGIATSSPASGLEVNGLIAGSSFFSSGNVGIGTNAPNDIFSIGNNGTAPVGSLNTGHNFTSTYLNADDYALTNYGLVKTLIGNATSSLLSLWGGTVGGSIWNLNSGNVGIGTTTPVVKLDVNGNTIFRSALNSSNYFNIRAYSDIYKTMTLYVNSSEGEARVLTARGNSVVGASSVVGVGPSSWIHGWGVPGNIFFRGDETILGVPIFGEDGFTGGTHKSLAIGTPQRSPSTGWGTTDIIDLGTFSIATNTWGGVRPSLRYTALEHNFRVNNTTGSGNPGTSALFIKSDANIGIGTTNPAYKLDVKGLTAASAVRSDMGFDIYPVPNPIAPTLSGTSGGGSVDAGLHYYYVTYVTVIGDSGEGNGLSVTVPAGSNTVILNIPVSSDPRVTGRKIYRTKAGDASYNEYYLATVSDNTTTTYTDTAADSSMTIFRPILNKTNATTNYITVGGVRAMVIDPKATIVGYGAGANITTGGMSVLLGPSAGYSMTTAVQNVAVGHQALYSTTGGGNNGAIGYYAMRQNTTGASNIAIGYYTLYNNQTGGYNTAIGNSAMTGASGQSNSYNTAVGYYTLGGITTGQYNTVLGYHAGFTTTSGSNNVFLGNYAGNYETGSSKLIIDSLDRANETRGRNEALIYGVTNATPASQILSLGGGGNVGIGTSAPNDTFSIGNSAAAAPSGSPSTGHNFTSTYLNSDDYALVNYGLLKTMIFNATSSISSASVGHYVGVTPTQYNGNNNGASGYTVAENACAVAFAGAAVCTPDNILSSISAGVVLPAEDVWIFAGPPGYTAPANDCEGRSVGTTAAYGTYWQMAMTGRPNGRGLLMTCNNALRIACCK